MRFRLAAKPLRATAINKSINDSIQPGGKRHKNFNFALWRPGFKACQKLYVPVEAPIMLLALTQPNMYFVINNYLIFSLTLCRLTTYICRTAPLTSRRCILNIYSTNIRTEYFKHAA
jgi:hypothetical protein